MGQNGAGADRAPWVRRALPQRRAAPGRQHGCPGGDRPGVRDHPAAAAAVAPQGDGRGLLEHLDPRLGGHQLRQATGDRAARLGAAGVHDPARRMAALQGQAQAAPRLGVEAHSPLAKLLHRRRRLASQHLHRLGTAQPATGVQGVVGVAGRGVVGRQRRRQPALRPVARRSRQAACARSARTTAPARRRAARRTGRPHRRRPPRRPSRPIAPRGGHRTVTDGALPRAIRPRSTTTPGPTPRTRHACGRSRRRSTRRAGRAWSGSRPRRRRSSSCGEFIPTSTSMRSRRSARGRRHDRRRHAWRARARSKRRSTPRGARRRPPSGCWPATHRFAFCGAAPAGPPRRGRPRDGLLPVQQRRGGRRARARRVRRRAGADPRLGRPPRQRHRGDLRRLRRVLYASIHQWPLYPGTGAADVHGRGGGRGVHGQHAGAAGLGLDRVPVARRSTWSRR